MLAAVGCDCSRDPNPDTGDAASADAHKSDATPNDEDANVAIDAATDAPAASDASNNPRHDGAVVSCQGIQCHLINNGCAASNRAR